MAMAMAKMMGIEIPDTIAGALAGQMQHIPGVMECANGHGNPAGQKFCGACGAPMSSLAAKAALPGPERPAEPPAAESFPSQEGKAVRLQDLRLDELPGRVPGCGPARRRGAQGTDEAPPDCGSQQRGPVAAPRGGLRGV